VRDEEDDQHLRHLVVDVHQVLGLGLGLGLGGREEGREEGRRRRGGGAAC